MVIEFGILGVPTNFSNYMKNRWVVAAKKDEWLQLSVMLGRMARVKAGVPIAERGHKCRMVHLHQIRTRLLDKDGLYASCKPIVDGLKSELRRKVDGKFVKVAGAGLIFNDDPSHADWEVTQERADGRENQITIKVEISEV